MCRVESKTTTASSETGLANFSVSSVSTRAESEPSTFSDEPVRLSVNFGTSSPAPTMTRAQTAITRQARRAHQAPHRYKIGRSTRPWTLLAVSVPMNSP